MFALILSLLLRKGMLHGGPQLIGSVDVNLDSQSTHWAEGLCLFNH